MMARPDVLKRVPQMLIDRDGPLTAQFPPVPQVVIGAAHRPHPMITAQRAIQRRMVELGLETGRVHVTVPRTVARPFAGVTPPTGLMVTSIASG